MSAVGPLAGVARSSGSLFGVPCREGPVRNPAWPKSENRPGIFLLWCVYEQLRQSVIASSLSSMRTADETRALVEGILSDPEHTAKVVLAAVQCQDIVSSSVDGKTPDGDGTLMVVGNQLGWAITVEPRWDDAVRSGVFER